MQKKLVFEHTAKGYPTVCQWTGKLRDGAAVWTDGVILVSDNAQFCAFEMTPGKKYRVTVEEVEEEQNG